MAFIPSHVLFCPVSKNEARPSPCWAERPLPSRLMRSCSVSSKIYDDQVSYIGSLASRPSLTPLCLATCLLGHRWTAPSSLSLCFLFPAHSSLCSFTLFSVFLTQALVLIIVWFLRVFPLSRGGAAIPALSPVALLALGYVVPTSSLPNPSPRKDI